MAAYAFARIRFPGSNVLFVIFLATMMVPFQLTIIPLYIILGQLQLDRHPSGADRAGGACSTRSGCS